MVGLLVAFHVAHAPLLLTTQLIGKLTEEVRINPVIEPIEIHGVPPGIEAGMLGLEADDRFAALAVFVVVAQLQAIGDQLQHLVAEMQAV